VSGGAGKGGKTVRHRLNRGGDRAANSALHIIAIGRLRTDQRTKHYVARRIAEGHSKLDAIRALSVTLLERSAPSSLSDAGRSTPRESPLDKQKGVRGSTFTAAAFASKLVTAGVAISMDGRGRFMDNIFIERLWRSIKYEEVHLNAYGPASAPG
jgi:transposase InsO family protein